MKGTKVFVSITVILSLVSLAFSSSINAKDNKVGVEVKAPYVVEKLVLGKTHGIWAKEVYADVGDTLRFKIRITYHDPDGNGPSYKIKWITVVDTLPSFLAYAYNSTTPETNVSLNGHTVSWLNLTGVELLDGQSFEIEYDAKVLGNGILTNTVQVYAFETCPHVWHNINATATVYATSMPAFKSRDVDNDGNNEAATDFNRDLTDGYEKYSDNDGSSSVVIAIDGDGDKKIDFFIDITGDGKPNRYWDPDDDILVYLKIKDIDGDGTKEWAFDSDNDGIIDRYYDPDDGKIHLYDTKPPTVDIIKPRKGFLYKNDIRRGRIFFRTVIIGPITIKAKVSDNYAIDRVEFYIDSKLKYTDKKEPYRWTWFFKPVNLKKKYTIEVKAYDKSGNSASQEIVVWRYRYHPILDHPIITFGSALLVGKVIKNLQGPFAKEKPPQPPEPPINQPPVADAGGPYKGNVSAVIHFDGSNSYDPDGTIVSYYWDFGDGETGTGKIPSHIYRKSGVYKVTLTVTDNDGGKSVDETTVEVSMAKTVSIKADLFWYIVGGFGAIISLLVLMSRKRLFK